MKITLPILALLLVSVQMAFTQPTLVKDNLQKNSHPNAASNPTNFINLGSKTYFFANGPTYDMGMYVTDGTENGTKLVKQINASVSNVVASDKLIYFVYENSSLFISDGTFEGTKPLAKFRSINKIINCNGTIYFTADDQIHGLELWKTDGTTAGTKLVKDIAYGLLSSQIVSWKSLGDKLILFANDGINGIEPWVSDGTEAGTKMIKDINQASGIEEYASEITLYQVNNYINFAADNGVNGVEFWSTNGTAEGTQMLKDINEVMVTQYNTIMPP
ncbi:MAG: hypothetical protein HC905_26670 [Bacteroidales bacterium]|nr:hypothetical protein [Bacteroidales bacterium]